jgi:hypothetical protein
MQHALALKQQASALVQTQAHMHSAKRPANQTHSARMWPQKGAQKGATWPVKSSKRSSRTAKTNGSQQSAGTGAAATLPLLLLVYTSHNTLPRTTHDITPPTRQPRCTTQQHTSMSTGLHAFQS